MRITPGTSISQGALSPENRPPQTAEKGPGREHTGKVRKTKGPRKESCPPEKESRKNQPRGRNPGPSPGICRARGPRQLLLEVVPVKGLGGNPGWTLVLLPAGSAAALRPNREEGGGEPGTPCSGAAGLGPRNPEPPVGPSPAGPDPESLRGSWRERSSGEGGSVPPPARCTGKGQALPRKKEMRT